MTDHAAQQAVPQQALAIEHQNRMGEALIARLWLWLWLLAGLLVLALAADLVLAWNAFYRFPVKQFVWTSDARAVCEAIPLDKPNISQARLRDLAAGAAVDLNSYDHANWKRLINNALMHYFTPRGRDLYRAALQDSGVIQKVVYN